MEVIHSVSFSDFILAVLVLCGVACIVWILDINPYSNKLQVYSQTCDNMILENTYCKGDWHDNPVETFSVMQDANQISSSAINQSEPVIYESCTIQDRKNWSCIDINTQDNITVRDGLIIKAENNDVRQISRLKWLQNYLLKIVD